MPPPSGSEEVSRSSSNPKEATYTATAKKVARGKLSLLELAADSKNLSRACQIAA